MKNDNSEAERLFEEEYPFFSEENHVLKTFKEIAKEIFVKGYCWGIARDKKWKNKP